MILKLAYVALASADPKRLCQLLGESLGLPAETRQHPDGNLVFYSLGQSRLCVAERGHTWLEHNDTTGVDHIAIDVGEHGFTQLPSTVRTNACDPQSVMPGWIEQRLSPDSTSDIPLRLCTGFEELKPTISNQIDRIDHIGVASRSCGDQEAIFHHALGCPIESRQTDYETELAVENFVSDRYGVIQHSRPARLVGGLRVLFLSIGDCELEMLEELNTTSTRAINRNAPGDTRQDRSAIGRFVERRGPGLHHVALKTEDINGLLTQLNNDKWRLIDHVGRPGSRRALIGFIHPADLGGVLIHFVQRQEWKKEH